MTHAFIAHVNDTLSGIEADGLYKREREITSPQSARIAVGAHDVLNLCANNYLGLADHPALIGAATRAMETNGFGMASVRFICGTQDLHRDLETRLAQFLGKDDAILFAACFDANGGLFEPLLGAEDAIISDALNHASIIDGIRLCKAQRYRYANSDMVDLEAQLQAQRELFGAWIFLLLLGQQQRGFEIGQPGRHHEVIGGQFQLQIGCALDIGEVLINQREDRNLAQIDLLAARKIEQEVQRPFPAIERKVELVTPLARWTGRLLVPPFGAGLFARCGLTGEHEAALSRDVLWRQVLRR